MHYLEIIDYQPAHQPYFRALNAAWIEKYFVLEDIDNLVLNHPEESIYKDGGVIIMARYEGKIVGTVALKRASETSFEMTKMAVDVQYQGYKIGYHLATAILEKAKEMGAEKVALYSQTSLAPAIQLYQKIGFKEVPLEAGKYKRCNIKMEIVFKTQAYLQNISTELKEIINETLVRFKTLQADTWKAKPDLRQWSKQEILGHLIDSAANNHQRFVRAQYDKPLELPGYEQNQWVSVQNYQNIPVAEIIEMWYVYNRQLVNVIKNIRYDAVETSIVIGTYPPVTLGFLIEDYIRHLKHHLEQIFHKTGQADTLQKENTPVS